MTKVMFLCCFYSVIFPASFFFGAVAIAATYATDKFLLMVRSSIREYICRLYDASVITNDLVPVCSICSEAGLRFPNYVTTLHS
jgi:hypothetical protein